jgi:hypothetical protein
VQDIFLVTNSFETCSGFYQASSSLGSGFVFLPGDKEAVA